MHTVPYSITPDAIMVVLGSTPRIVSSTNLNFNALRAALLDPNGHNLTLIEELADVRKFIAKKSFGRVQVSDTEIRYDGVKINNHTTERVLDMLRKGYDLTPVGNFLNKVMQNPSKVAQEELYLWLESGNQPLTPEGNVLAFKRVRPDYTDIHSGKFDNSVGAKIPPMKREDVDPDRDRTCSRGYHFCSYGYLPHFSSYDGQNDHIMIVEVNPANIVAIPNDYANQKGRCTVYDIVGEVSLEDAEHVFDNTPVVRMYMDDEDDGDYVEDCVAEDTASTTDHVTMMFYHAATNRSHLSDDLIDLVDNVGVMEASRQLNVPKSTLQGWLHKSYEAN